MNKPIQQPTVLKVGIKFEEYDHGDVISMFSNRKPMPNEEFLNRLIIGLHVGATNIGYSREQIDEVIKQIFDGMEKAGQEGGLRQMPEVEA